MSDGLLGRDEDLTAVDRLLDGARSSSGGAVVVRGEAGVGKTALLAAIERRATGMRVVRAVGVESEAELPFAGLHQVLAPGLGHLDALPPPQAAALRGAFGVSAEAADDRFLISLGALGILAELADDSPVLVLVDDAQWLDRPSAEALGFVARRLAAEPVAMVIAAREGEARRFEGAGIPERRLRGLDPEAARELLVRNAGGGLAAHVADHLVAVTGGNPLALVELPSSLAAEQLAGRAPLPDRLPLAGRIERTFVERASRLGDSTRAVLAVAAADDTGAIATVVAAARLLGADVRDLEDAEASGLIATAGERVDLRHPMAWSALMRGLPLSLRQAAHRALAEVLSGDDDADRRAWHLAGAALGPDAAIAEALERSAERAGVRGGHAAAAAALERAAQLSVDDDARGRRLVAAAEAAWRGGRAPHAQALADRAEPLVDGDLRTRLRSVRAAIAEVLGRPADAHSLLMDAAAVTADPAAMADLTLRAGEAAVVAGDTAGVARARDRLADLPAGVAPIGRRWIAGVAAAMAGDMGTAVGHLREAAARAPGVDDPRRLVWAANAHTWLGDHDRTIALNTRAIEVARARGAFATLAVALTRRGALLAYHGRATEAWEDAEEALSLTREAGLENSVAQSRAVLAIVAALRGDVETCEREAETAIAGAAARGLTPAWESATYALSTLRVGRRDYEAALDRLLPLAGGGTRAAFTPLSYYAAVPELVEAAVRAGRPEVAVEPLERLTRWTELTGATWARPLAVRCAGLMADGPRSVDLLEEALALHPGVRRSFGRAWTQLLLGEALRRERRRGDARMHLRAALEAFEAVRADGWAERARDELRATGETVRRRDAGGGGSLTPQEQRIARFVAQGASNKEVAAQLFLSPKTVEYHLAKVFAKLGIASRAELLVPGVLGGDPGLN